MFDFTRKVILEPKLQARYNILRALLHFFFLMAMLFVSYRILFPIIPLDFAMNTPNSTKNTLVSPRISQSGEFPSKGLVKAGDTFLFNASPVGQFSKANITFSLGKNSDSIENTAIKVRKSYQAFFYPLGEPIGLRNATLASTSAGDYYIVSDGLLRKFANTDIILKLGYPKSAFIEVASDDLRANKAGSDIADDGNYPNDTLFFIDDNYYQLEKQQLFPFISAQAFLSQFDPVSAIAKNSDFLSRYPVSEKYLGFADGTLASLADSVFILSGDKSYPIENEVTFSAMGFAWENVIPVSANELGAYEKQKQFTNNDPHPNGTIFIDQKTSKQFIIADGKRRPINSAAAAKTYAKQKPIVADSLGAEKESSCHLKKKLLSSNVYECGVSLEALASLIGNDYQLSATFPADANLNTINATFSTPLTIDSLKNSLSLIKNRLKNK